MDYKERIRRAETLGRKLLEYGEKMCSPDLCTCANVMLEDITAITDLLSRTEAAEARCALLDEARENANEACAKWEGMYRMALERAEKAEKERDAAVEQLRGVLGDDYDLERLKELVGLVKNIPHVCKFCVGCEMEPKDGK